MKRHYKIVIVALVVVAVLIAAVTTTALAAQKTNTPDLTRPTAADYQAWGCPLASGNYESVAALLGMTTQEIQTQLEQGNSLVEIAASKGVSEDELVAAIFEPMKQYMQQQVTSGAWTQAQMDSHLKVAEQHVRQLVNAKGNDADGGCGGTDAGGMMGGGGLTNNGPFGRGSMMGGGYGGMMGGVGGFGGMMGGSGGTGFRGMMGNVY